MKIKLRGGLADGEFCKEFPENLTNLADKDFTGLEYYLRITATCKNVMYGFLSAADKKQRSAVLHDRAIVKNYFCWL